MSNIRVSIDLWNGYIKWIVFNREDNRDIIIAKDTIKTEGYRKGKILDSNLLSESLIQMVDNFQKRLWWDYIDDVIVGLSHPELLIERVSEHKRILWSPTIQLSDITTLSKLMNDISQKNNFEIVKIMPAYWLIDEDKIEQNPEWVEWKKLTMVADIFYLPKVFYQNIVDIFHTLNINIIDIIPNIIANSETLLDVDHKDLWSVLIDMGANQTSYSVFEEWHALLYGVLPVGWDEVTKDISIGLQIDIKQADAIKTHTYETTDEEIRLDEKFLHEIMHARYEQIYEKINKSLKKIGKEGKLAGGIHLTGQASLRNNALDYAKEIFKLAVFNAKHSISFRDIKEHSWYDTAISLYLWSNKYHNKNKWLFSFRGIQSGGKSFFDSISNFFKDLF